MKRLLLIDDDAAFLRVLGRTLERHDYRVTPAASAAEANTALARQRFSHAVVDLKLESESGLDLLPALRDSNASMRIVILTGYASIATTVEAIKRGADDYLPKPLDLDSLLSSLENSAPGRTLPPEQPMSLKRLEWEHIQRVLAEHNGNISAAARALGMHRRTLQRRLAKRPVNR